MDKMRTPMAKILVHSEGLGAPNAALVRQRAEELAAINGHSAYTEGDWRQARIELHGAHSVDGALSDEMGMNSMASEADMLTVDVGHHTERAPLEDDRNIVEELWTEGMEEAEHDRMLAAVREDPADAEEEDAAAE